MVPVNWTDECVRLVCEHCGAHKLLHGVHYRQALSTGGLVECSTCTAREQIRLPTAEDQTGAAPARFERRPPVIARSGGVAERVIAETRLRAEPRSVGSARDFVRLGLRGMPVGESAARDLTTAASEAVTNAILHGAPCANGEIGLRLEGNGGVAVEVSDCGTFEPPTGDADPLDTNGRGLTVIEALVDDLQIHAGTGGTTLRMVKRVPVAQDAAAA